MPDMAKLQTAYKSDSKSKHEEDPVCVDSGCNATVLPPSFE